MKSFALLVAFMIATWSTYAQNSLSQLIGEIVEVHHEKNGFEGVVLVATGGEVQYHEAFGLADYNGRQVVEPDDRFKIASITKKFTAIRVLQLYGQERLGLNSSIASFLPKLPIKDAKKITIRDLLMHTSGLPKESDMDFVIYDNHLEMAEAVLSRRSAYGKRGVFRYNNIDYILLGLVIERLTDQTWQENITNHILEPLAMKSTGFLSSNGAKPTLVKGRIYGGSDIPQHEPDYSIGNFHAAAAMYSNASDLYRLDLALSSFSLLDESLTQTMYDSDPSLGYVALGSWVYRYPYLDSYPLVVERRGGLPGFNHVFLRLPELNSMVLILSNNDRFNPDTFGDTGNMKEQLLKVVAQAEK